ncbi:hypothetical protein NPIL_626941 [Nephila pilipes]|uniref:DUF7041 domain-containing protein n=1 Tax=Nephila pilipes TaxID=299642 RepID=A0A8X6TCS3_NEPPI|nr:hypothetical protein NPIL_626941 [Nephila pilipes]
MRSNSASVNRVESGIAKITKFHHVIAALQRQELSIVRGLLHQSPEDKPNAMLKACLCTQYKDKEAQSLKNLMSCVQFSDKEQYRVLIEMKS